MKVKAEVKFVWVEDAIVNAEWQSTQLPVDPAKYPGIGCQQCGKALMDVSLIKKLDLAQRYAEAPFRILAGYKCPDCERSLEESTSCPGMISHRDGLAVDIAIEDDQHRATVLFSLLQAGFNRIGLGRDSVHVDVDKRFTPRVAWFCCSERKTAVDRLFSDAHARFGTIFALIVNRQRKSFDIRPNRMVVDGSVTVPGTSDPAAMYRKARKASLAMAAARQQDLDSAELMRAQFATVLALGMHRDGLSRGDIINTFARENNLPRPQVARMADGIQV
jgi:hypothetical protein